MKIAISTGLVLFLVLAYFACKLHRKLKEGGFRKTYTYSLSSEKAKIKWQYPNLSDDSLKVRSYGILLNRALSHINRDINSNKIENFHLEARVNDQTLTLTLVSSDLTVLNGGSID